MTELLYATDAYLKEMDATVQEIRDYLSVDSLGYLSLDGLLACERDGRNFCHACFSGRYPVPVDPSASKLSIEHMHRAAQSGAGL